jgi:acetylornithine deacetylase/succinyl-diaminopimelate desuccinylase-like protein
VLAELCRRELVPAIWLSGPRSVPSASGRVTQRLVPKARLVPMLMSGGTDGRFFRRVGTTAYGAGLFSERIPFGDFARMAHGANERIDQESLRLSSAFWLGTVTDLLS